MSRVNWSGIIEIGMGIVQVSSKSVASGGGQHRDSVQASLKSLSMEASDRIGVSVKG